MAACNCAKRHAAPAQAVGIDLDVVLLGQAAEPDHVDDAGNLAKLLLQDPILRGLQVGQRVALAHDLVAVELPDGAPRGQRGRHPRRQRDESQLVEHPLLRGRVRRVPAEVAFDVANPNSDCDRMCSRPGMPTRPVSSGTET
jgi:hypothetical protein